MCISPSSGVSPVSHPFASLVQHHRLRLVDLEKYRRLDVHANQDESRIVFRSMPRVAVVGKPDLPIRRVELRDLLPIARQGGQAGHRDPFARAVLVVGQVDVRVGFDIAKLGSPFSGHEPEVGAGRMLLVRHRPRLEMSVRAAGRHHRDLDVVDQRVELVELGLHAHLVNLHSSETGRTPLVRHTGTFLFTIRANRRRLSKSVFTAGTFCG